MSNGKKTKKSTPGFDWSLVPHGPVSGAVVGSLVLTAAGAVGEAAHVSPVWAVAGAGVGAFGAVLEGANRDAGPGALLYRLGCWLGAGSWLTLAWASDQMLSPNGLAALGVGAVGAAALYPLGRARKPVSRRKPGADLVPVTARSAGPLAAEWEARFKRVCRLTIEVVDVQHWDNNCGYNVIGQLPPGPATISQVAAAADALATDARLPDGCGVEPPTTGSHRGEFVLPVSTRNVLGQRGDEHPPKVHYPADYSPRSLLDAVRLGVRRDGTVGGPSLREDSMLVTGPKGGGKTNVLDVLTAEIGRCRDALVWHLDLNGGGMSQLWLHPWLEGRTDRPAIDWAAPNPEEALLMVTVMVAIAKDRKSSYRTYKARNNVKLLPISADLPAIELLVDEGAESLSPRETDPVKVQVREGLEELLRIGRNEAAVPHFSALRPVSTCISPDVLSGCAWRLGMFGTSAADLGHMYEWPKGLNADELPVKGTTFISRRPDAPHPLKAWYMEPEQIQDAAVAIAGYRPELDEASVEVANSEFEIRLGPKGTKPILLSDIYAGRYDRMRAAFTGQPVDLIELADDDAPRTTTATAAPRPAPAQSAPGKAAPSRPATARPAEVVPAPAIAGVPALRVLKGGAANWPDLSVPAAPEPEPVVGGTAANWPDLFPAPSTRPSRPSRPAPKTSGPDTGPAAGRAAGSDAPTAVAEVAAPEILARALAAFTAAGDDRMHSEVLAEALGYADQWALAEALRPYGVTTLPNKFTRNGAKKRGYSRDDIAAAAVSAAAG